MAQSDDMTLAEAGLTEDMVRLEECVGSVLRIHRIESMHSRQFGPGVRLDVTVVGGKNEEPKVIATFALPVVRRLSRLMSVDCNGTVTLERPLRVEVVRVGQTFDLQ